MEDLRKELIEVHDLLYFLLMSLEDECDDLKLQFLIHQRLISAYKNVGSAIEIIDLKEKNRDIKIGGHKNDRFLG